MFQSRNASTFVFPHHSQAISQRESLASLAQVGAHKLESLKMPPLGGSELISKTPSLAGLNDMAQQPNLQVANMSLALLQNIKLKPKQM